MFTVNQKAARKEILRPALLALALCAPIFMDARAAAEPLRRVFYGTTASPAHLPVWVAKDAGLFAQRGLEVEPVQIRGGSLITLAIITGELPFSGAGAESVVAARAAGGDVVLLACPIDTDPVYLIARPEIKSAAGLKGQASAVTRFGSSTHFYLRFALKHVGLDPDRDVIIMQLGAGPEIVAALDAGRIAAAALTTRYAIPFLERGWPVLVDLSKTDLVYPASCVTSSRAFIRAEPKVTENFLAAYVEGIRWIRQNHELAEKSFSKWLREKDPAIVKRSVAAYARLFKPAPVVPDKGIENVIKDLLTRRAELKQYLGWPEPFRENGPLAKVLREK
ncbi:MAG TPA: ABC transporter substrate-binding protein [Candidatus Acidoferrales bacterium]|nr:ABC transporter substrate-binding protein [Candidatus Acidoferrales bacterium]